MAPRRPVLGNDPFRQGAAPREGEPRREPPPAPASVAPVTPRRRRARERPAPVESRSAATAPPGPDTREREPTPPPAPWVAAPPLPPAPQVNPAEAARGALSVVLRLAGLPSGSPSLEVDELGRDAQLEREVWPLLEWIHDRWFRVELRGEGALPAGPVVVVANRAGLVPWDSLMLAVSARRLGRELRPLVEDYLFHFPGLGVLINRLGAVRACPENAERILGAGGAVAVFPEGAQGMGKRYRDRYRLQRFGRGGFVKLALRSGASIVPAAIVGSEEANPVLGRLPGLLGLPLVPVTPTFPWLGLAGLLPLPGRWVIELGAPVDLGGRGPDDASDGPAVMRLTEATRSTIQAMLDRLTAERR